MQPLAMVAAVPPACRSATGQQAPGLDLNDGPLFGDVVAVALGLRDPSAQQIGVHAAAHRAHRHGGHRHSRLPGRSHGVGFELITVTPASAAPGGPLLVLWCSRDHQS